MDVDLSRKEAVKPAAENPMKKKVVRQLINEGKLMIHKKKTRSN